MNKLEKHIKTEGGTMTAWAVTFGISRAFLYGLVDGSRNPSLPIAQRIATKTGNSVPITSWPNIKAIIDAAKDDAA